MVLLYFTGVSTLWNHWGFLVALLFQRVNAGEPGWGGVWGNIHLHFCLEKYVLWNVNTVELSGPGNQWECQLLVHVPHKLFQTGCHNQLGKAFFKNSMHVSTGFAGWGSGSYCLWEGQQLFPHNRDVQLLWTSLRFSSTSSPHLVCTRHSSREQDFFSESEGTDSPWDTEQSWLAEGVAALCCLFVHWTSSLLSTLVRNHVFKEWAQKAQRTCAKNSCITRQPLEQWCQCSDGSCSCWASLTAARRNWANTSKVFLHQA